MAVYFRQSMKESVLTRVDKFIRICLFRFVSTIFNEGAYLT